MRNDELLAALRRMSSRRVSVSPNHRVHLQCLVLSIYKTHLLCWWYSLALLVKK
jgi:hypothetical protein